MADPLVYEINTRCWLRELPAAAGRPATLAEVPDSEFAQWERYGFTHIWLMGVWTGGPAARAEALKLPQLRHRYTETLPDWQEADVAASPYAIAEYRVPPALGGEAGLAEFRRKLNQHGLKLLLDFVPNHVGLDHSWLRQRPELFVQGPKDAPKTFPQETGLGTRWLAHGKDPCFPAWTDTVQLDYRLPATRAEMSGLLQTVAERCDGVRCDMAMLLLSDIFAKTWERFPVPAASLPVSDSEFWPPAITAVKKARPDFLFLAEVYWDLESRLRALGFDYTYDKVLYERLVARNASGVQAHLAGMIPGAVAASAHFLENHDEPRIASLLSATEQRAAALLILGLPGMRLLHEGQLSGARRSVPVQLVRRPVEPKQSEVEDFYRQLLTALPATAVGGGKPEIIKPRAAWPGNSTAEDMAVVQWQDRAPEFDLAVVNLAPHRSQCYAPLSVANLPDHNWSMVDLLSDENYKRDGDDLQHQGLYLDLPPHGAQLFHFQPAS
jgi:glycosidase